MTKKVKSHDDGARLARYRDEFEHPSVFGLWKNCWKSRDIPHEGEPPRVYAIYSYGYHFPMYVWDELSGQWLGNSSKYSRTTSTHQSKYRPPEVAKWFGTAELKAIVDCGLVGYITQRMEEGLPVA
jgi:hypothetical protein